MKATAPRVTGTQQPAAKLVAALSAGSASLVVTDPPHRSVDRHGGGHLRRWFRGSLSWTEIANIMRLARRRLRPDGLLMLVVNEAGLPSAQEALRRAGFDRQRLIVWDQRVPGLGTGLRHQVGYVVIGLQPASRGLHGRDLLSVAAVAPGTRNRYPTEKPVGLGRELAAIAGISRADTVIDPFCGSGNLLVGAAERGAQVIAGDTSTRAVRLATARLRAASHRGGPSLDSSQISGTQRPPRSAATKKPLRRPAAGRAKAKGKRR